MKGLAATSAAMIKVKLFFVEGVFLPSFLFFITVSWCPPCDGSREILTSLMEREANGAFRSIRDQSATLYGSGGR
jgi:hypothetical protein